MHARCDRAHPRSRRHYSQDTSALQRDAVELAARLAIINLQARALAVERAPAVEKASLEARLEDVHDALARSAAAAPSPAELEVQGRARALARAFGYTAPFDFQLRAVGAVCTGRNTCLVWPAGAGKGLCTQLVAACLPGMSMATHDMWRGNSVSHAVVCAVHVLWGRLACTMSTCEAHQMK